MLARLDGNTRVSVIIGTPIAQVRSPEGITREMQARGVNALLVPLEVQPQDVAAMVAALGKVSNLDGITVTVPHKQAAFACCGTVSERARILRAVNVMRRLDDGSFAGDHVDGESLINGLNQLRFDVAGRRALVVGAGGAGSAIVLALIEAQASEVVICDVDTARRDDLLQRMTARFGGRAVGGENNPRGFGLVVNATPAGMRAGEAPPIDPTLIDPGTMVCDVVTPPGKSALIVAAEALGCPTLTGQQMFDAGIGLITDFMLGRSASR